MTGRSQEEIFLLLGLTDAVVALHLCMDGVESDMMNETVTSDGVRQLYEKAFEAAVEAFVAPMRCTTPGRPAPGIEHCAACCMQTGYDVGSEDELELARALDDVLDLIRRVR
jgi:predicted transcriptional regulator